MRQLNQISKYRMKFALRIGLFAALFMLFVGPMTGVDLFAQESGKYTVPQAIEILDGKVTTTQNNINTVWMLMSGFLVFFMQAGFMLLELGFARAKNTVNVIMKNFLDCCVASITFYLFGFGLMFGANAVGLGNGLIGSTHFGIPGLGSHDLSTYDPNHWTWAFWFFQVAFASTACTIVSGAMAERTKFRAYLIYAFVIAAFIYPLVGHWCWGGGFSETADSGQGWLYQMKFIDFAGSTVVHATGGACSLAGIIVVGARTGRFGADGSARLIAGHNIPLAAMGTFTLWFCWFGFNCGSTLVGGANIGLIAANTHLAACAGALVAMLAMWLMQGRADLAIALNGSLAGLVSITAGCSHSTPLISLAIGGVGGLLATFATIGLEMIKLDDVVGAVPVHMVGGMWGTIAVGFIPLCKGEGMNWEMLKVQTLGTFACTGFSFISALLLFYILKATVGLRVGDTEQREGLDFHEHAATAYPDFATTEQNL
jgi:Amt family ammonium transporter